MGTKRRTAQAAPLTPQPAQERLHRAPGRPPERGSAGRTAALSGLAGPSESIRPPSSFFLGDRAVISGRAAAWLTSRAGLAELRASVRGDDPEIDAALLSLAVAAAHWRSSLGGTIPAPREELPARSSGGLLSTREVAARSAISIRGVRAAIESGRLPAELDDSGRWAISVEDSEHWQAARAA